MSEKPPFEFGQTVYIARAGGWNPVDVPCPVCFGKRFVRLELGNGEMQASKCEYCAPGYEEPRGTIRDYQAASQVVEAIVTGIEKDREGWRISASPYSERENIFATRDEAEARRIVLHAEAEKHHQQNFEAQFKNARGKVSWTVGYHRAQLADLRRKMQWHQNKLMGKSPAAERTK